MLFLWAAVLAGMNIGKKCYVCEGTSSALETAQKG